MNFQRLEQRNMLATLIGTPGDDVFAAGPGWANLNGTAYVGDYDFDGGAGRDIASLYDTPDDGILEVAALDEPHLLKSLDVALERERSG